MAKFIIHGGKKLSGRIEVAGAKNQALKLIIASILTSGTDINIILHNVSFLKYQKINQPSHNKT